MKLLFLPALFLILVGCSHTSPSLSTKNTEAQETKNPIAQKYDAELSQYSYPFEVKFFNFRSQNQDLKMAYMDIPAGLPSAKIIVLLHGKNFSGAYFQQLILGLNQEGYRVIIPDQIGFGKSSKPQQYQYSFQTLAENTKALLTHLGVEKSAVLGHSMGGMLATRYTLMYPQNVAKLYLVNPIGLEDWRTLTSYRNIDESFKAELSMTSEKFKQYQIENYFDGKWKSDYDSLLDIPTGWLNGPDYKLIAWNSALTTDMIFTQPVVYEYKNIKVPTVLLIGDRDRTAIGKAWASEDMKRKMGNYPALSKQIVKLIPKAKLITYKNLGHIPFTEDFELFWKSFVREI